MNGLKSLKQGAEAWKRMSEQKINPHEHDDPLIDAVVELAKETHRSTDTARGILLLCLCVASFCFYLVVCEFGRREEEYQQQAVQRGVARYNEDGKFEWVEESNQ